MRCLIPICASDVQVTFRVPYNYKVHMAMTHNIYIILYIYIYIQRILHSSMVSMGLSQAHPNNTYSLKLNYVSMTNTVTLTQHYLE